MSNLLIDDYLDRRIPSPSGKRGCRPWGFSPNVIGPFLGPRREGRQDVSGKEENDDTHRRIPLDRVVWVDPVWVSHGRTCRDGYRARSPESGTWRDEEVVALGDVQ